MPRRRLRQSLWIRCERSQPGPSVTGVKLLILCHGALMNFANSANTINLVGWIMILCNFLFSIRRGAWCPAASTSPAGQNRPLGLGGTASWNSGLFQIDPTLLQLDVDLARRSFTFETATPKKFSHCLKCEQEETSAERLSLSAMWHHCYVTGLQIFRGYYLQSM